MRLILRIVINAVAIWLTTLLMAGFSFSGSLVSLLGVGVVFGLVNALIRPLVRLLTLPVTLVTLGLFSLVINALMLMLTTWLSDSLSLTGGLFQNFLTALGGAILNSIISTVLSWLLPDKR